MSDRAQEVKLNGVFFNKITKLLVSYCSVCAKQGPGPGPLCTGHTVMKAAEPHLP